MNEVTVHRYKYSQESRRRILKKLSKQGFIKFLGVFKDRIYYEINTKEGMEEYIRRTKQ